MAFPLKQTYTIDDIYALPEGQRAELIDGQMYRMAPPGTMHQRIIHLLEWRIEDYIRQKEGDCQVFAAPMIFPFDQTVVAGIYGDLNITITELLS
ncbi:MAG: Uma2 family endonuclease [Roseburia sp.]|jgi:Uma2 family endonuclease|nr:Uma2 family endonuclease [Roseburia sp.]